MDKLLKNAMIAWNPIGEVAKRLENGSLTLATVIPSYIAVIIASNLLAIGSQKFFIDVLTTVMRQSPMQDPLLDSNFAMQVLSTVGVVVPALVVAVLPAGVFRPVGKNATISALFIVMAGWAFYGAVMSLFEYFLPALVLRSDPEAGMKLFITLSILGSIIIIGLTLWFWFKVLLGKLRLSGGSVALVTIAYGIGLAILILLFMPIIGTPY